MSPTTKKHQQLILLEPRKAGLLDEVAAETRIAKQVLLREAVDDLLSRYRKGEVTTRYMRIRAALKAARKELTAYRRSLAQQKAGIVPLQNCTRAIDRVDEARAVTGD